MPSRIKDKQKSFHEQAFSSGSRAHVISDDPLVRYITRWRLVEGMARLCEQSPHEISKDSTIILLCAGDGLEATVLADLGYKNVTTSDLSDAGVRAAIVRDPRLSGISLDAEDTQLPDASYDVVIVQDGLHHLARPVQGFNEMLRISRKAAMFLEPHDSWIGRKMGTDWEQNGDAINYVFRWTTRMVDEIASSYLGPGSFINLSFSFWHHNILFDKLGKRVGGGKRGIYVIRTIKAILDSTAHRAGNQFCGLIAKT